MPPAFKNRDSANILAAVRGGGFAVRDGAEYEFSAPALLCFSLYQSLMIRSGGEFKGILIQFTPSFFCLFQHRQEVSCNGVLFNNLYDTPLVRLTPAEAEVSPQTFRNTIGLYRASFN